MQRDQRGNASGKQDKDCASKHLALPKGHTNVHIAICIIVVKLTGIL